MLFGSKIQSKPDQMLRYLLIGLVFCLISCYPIEESMTGPVEIGQAVFMLDGRELNGSCLYVDSYPDIIKIQISENSEFNLSNDNFEQRTYYTSTDTIEFFASFSSWNRSHPSGPTYHIYNGRLRIDVITEEYVEGAFDVALHPLTGKSEIDIESIIQIYGRFKATYY